MRLTQIIFLKKKKKLVNSLVFSGFYDSSAFVGVLAVFEACSVAGWAFPFCSATGTCGFVFISPDFKVASTNVTFNVRWFGLD
jgi:hypothetical protein